MVSDKHVGYIA